MNEVLNELGQLVTKRHLFNAVSAALILLVGFFVARRASETVSRLSHLDVQRRILFKRVSYYAIVLLTLAMALSQLGFDLKVLLGAAGVLTVAVGFAAQTSASNLISGIFLMIERPFIVGDVIQVGDIKGEVLAIDLLSCRIRTFDNLMVRVPNETMVKSNIINLSYFPIRRIDIQIGVAYKENISSVRDVLMDVARHNPLCLDAPSPLFIFNGFGDSSLNMQFSVWVLRENIIALQNSVYEDIKVAFDERGIEIPYPHRTLIHVGAGS